MTEERLHSRLVSCTAGTPLGLFRAGGNLSDVGEVAGFGDLESAQHRKIEVPAADHRPVLTQQIARHDALERNRETCLEIDIRSCGEPVAGQVTLSPSGDGNPPQGTCLLRLRRAGSIHSAASLARRSWSASLSDRTRGA